MTVSIRLACPSDAAQLVVIEKSAAIARGTACVTVDAVTLTTFRGVTWNEPFYQSLGFTILSHDELDDRLARKLAK